MIGIICAMQVEADGIVALMSDKKQEEFYNSNYVTGTINNKQIVVVVCGVGKVNASMCATILIDKYAPSLIINSGVAGALSNKISIGDIVVATKSVEHDMNATALGDKQGEVTMPNGLVMYFDCDKTACEKMAKICKNIPNTKVELGVVASGDIFVSDRQQRLKIATNFNAIACEMEGAAIGHICYRCNVPYVIIRAISDDLDENKGMDFVKFCKLASDKTVIAIKNFLTD